LAFLTQLQSENLDKWVEILRSARTVEEGGFEGRLTHLTEEEIEAFEGALTVGLQVRLLVRAVLSPAATSAHSLPAPFETERQFIMRACLHTLGLAWWRSRRSRVR
jgi:hypothetical protein